jgi:hypothetical protein
MAENLGEFLSGDRIDNSPYELFMRDDTTCNILCQQHYGKRDVEAFKTAIDEGYHHNWIIDNLPAAAIVAEDGYVETSYSKGFPVGYKVPKGVDASTEATPLYSGGGTGGVMADMDATAEYYLFNHVELIIKYHELGPDANRVVGFYVEPRSVKHLFANGEHWYPDAADDYMPYLTTCEKYAEDPIDAAAEDNAEWSEMYGGPSAKSYGVNGLVEPMKVSRCSPNRYHHHHHHDHYHPLTDPPPPPHPLDSCSQSFSFSLDHHHHHPNKTPPTA